jgi:hypothetical protein
MMGEIPIMISNGYRSEEVNRKCGGAVRPKDNRRKILFDCR